MNSLFHSLDAALAPSPASTDLGQLPQWRLEDLYEGMDSPRFAADLERAERRSQSCSPRPGEAGSPNAPAGRTPARRWPRR